MNRLREKLAELKKPSESLQNDQNYRNEKARKKQDLIEWERKFQSSGAQPTDEDSEKRSKKSRDLLEWERSYQSSQAKPSDTERAKSKKKQDMIEWERSRQSAGSQSVDGDDQKSKRKQEILANMWKEQRNLSANVSSIQSRKDKDREALLDSIIQLEKHSEELVERLSNWKEREERKLELLEAEETAAFEKMLRYDCRVNLRRNAVIEAMEETLRRERLRFAITDELREFNQLEIRAKLNEREQLQREAFEALQRTRDYRHHSITSHIQLIETELSRLTRAEMEKRDDKLDAILADIREQRSKLAYLLARLLAERRERELQLREQLLRMEARRAQIDDDDFWLVQYQYLLERQPILDQIREYGIDERVGRALIGAGEEIGDTGRLIAYLPLFARIDFERLNDMTDKDISRLGVDDYELCGLIRDRLDEESALSESASARPSAPQFSSDEGRLFSPDESPVCDTKLWRQTECVVCLDQSCNIVFLPCGHVCTCVGCGSKLNMCPMCRTAIDVQQLLLVDGC